MNELFRAEWIKFRSSRSNWILLLIGIAVSLAVVVLLVALFGNSVGDSVPDTSPVKRASLISAGSIMSLIFISIVGVRVFGNELRTGTMERAAIAAPIRAEAVLRQVRADGCRGVRVRRDLLGPRHRHRVHRAHQQGLLDRARRPGRADATPADGRQDVDTRLVTVSVYPDATSPFTVGSSLVVPSLKTPSDSRETRL